ncbi:MAG TPA: VWA domain-containing protein [Chloroflexia bacterium]|nr:VWA domain-containing protein [Chloroflexia bacterium]
MERGVTTQQGPGDQLLRRWIEFGRLLRRNGVGLTAGQVGDLLHFVSTPGWDWSDRDTMYLVARALLCGRHEEWPRFDVIFRQFWGRTRQVIIPSDATTSRPETQVPAAVTQAGEPEAPGTQAEVAVDRWTGIDAPAGEDAEITEPPRPEQILRYSAAEQLRRRDFAEFTDEEIARARALLAGWRWEPGRRRTRRLAAARRGRRLHLGPTLRRAMRTGGVPFQLSWRGPREKPRPLVVICDISGSMAPYTRLLLHFLYTLRHGLRRVEVFVFGTRLTRITRPLRARAVDTALAEVGQTVIDWSGGTRIGDALRNFNTTWARRMLGQGAAVCIISDGWDRGDPELLAREMEHLQRMAFRLIWLNPLLGVPGYQPLTRGMATALPFVDDFLPATNLYGLEALAHLLSHIPPTRPIRRQGQGRRPGTASA